MHLPKMSKGKRRGGRYMKREGSEEQKERKTESKRKKKKENVLKYPFGFLPFWSMCVNMGRYVCDLEKYCWDSETSIPKFGPLVILCPSCLLCLQELGKKAFSELLTSSASRIQAPAGEGFIASWEGWEGSLQTLLSSWPSSSVCHQ